ncbi:diguanylate cyclase [Psychromonas sp.]|nr:diguanylate cyclase [Psychromonas sp.]
MPQIKYAHQEAQKIENVVQLKEHNVSHSHQPMDNFELVMSQMNIADEGVFQKEFSQQWKDAAIKKERLSVLLCEIDFYDEYVKNYGVQAASFMQISIALVLKHVCERHGCFLARSEHQGFSILFKGGDTKEVQGIVDALCAAVKNSKTEHKHSNFDDFITLSIGTSSSYPSMLSLLSDNALSALNMAKMSGGNQVSVVNFSTDINPSMMIESARKIVKEPVRTLDSKVKNVKELIESEVKIQSKSSGKTNHSADKKDYFAEPEKENVVAPRMYRGQIIQNDPKPVVKNALKSNDTALNSSKVGAVNDKPKQVRYYRGQAITS